MFSTLNIIPRSPDEDDLDEEKAEAKYRRTMFIKHCQIAVMFAAIIVFIIYGVWSGEISIVQIPTNTKSDEANYSGWHR